MFVCVFVCQGEHPPRAEAEEKERCCLHCPSGHWTGEACCYSDKHILIPSFHMYLLSVYACVCSGPRRSSPAAAPPGWPGQRGWCPTAEEPVHPDQSGDDWRGRETVVMFTCVKFLQTKQNLEWLEIPTSLFKWAINKVILSCWA